MPAIDTNVLIRLLVRDDEKQVSAAEVFVEKGAWVSHLVLAETAWVLDSVYDLSASQIAEAMHLLLNHRQLSIQDGDVVEAALQQFQKRPTLSFSDTLIIEVARKAGHLPLGTFDRDLSRVNGAHRL